MKAIRTLMLSSLVLLPFGMLAAEKDGAAPKLQVGDPAPALKTGTWLKGDPVRKFEKDTVYLVEFWATWCGPCVKNIPHMTELQKKYPKLVVIGQNCQERDQASVKGFVEKQGAAMDYRVVLDDTSKEPLGAMYKDWMEASGARGIPHAFLVDQKGRIAWAGHPAQLTAEIIEAALAGKLEPQKPADNRIRIKDGQLQLPGQGI
ncbi:MAG TPA: TlpA disulfide reductase family protein [Luteolibacter sp.]|nr:TlpA disulfide reductase family protein [Luteolibacter sp.]